MLWNVGTHKHLCFLEKVASTINSCLPSDSSSPIFDGSLENASMLSIELPEDSEACPECLVDLGTLEEGQPRHRYDCTSCAACGEPNSNGFCKSCEETIMNSQPVVPYLNIYGQHHEHCDAFIVGSRDGLIALRDAIDMVLWSGEPEQAQTISVDGEGYSTIVVLHEARPWFTIKTFDDRTLDLALPYTGKYYHHVYDLVVPDRYRKFRDEG